MNVFGYAALFLACLAGWAIASCEPASEQTRPGHVYDTPFGSVYCARHERTACGMTLSVCHDGATYSCVMNVRQREAEPAKAAPPG